MVRFLTAGESHGRALVVILEGIPAGLQVDFDAITRDLRRRQGGYGRGRRMAIESDHADVLSGIRHGRTTGGPVALQIVNKDWDNWRATMEPTVSKEAPGESRPRVTRPRPGHADLAGALKYGHEDIRDVIERASARETAARVAAGAVARQLLSCAGIGVVSHVTVIGGQSIDPERWVSFDEAARLPAESPLRSVDPEAEQRMIQEIDRAKEAGDTVGGAFEVIARGVPWGLGSYVQWDRRLDGRLAQALMSVPAIKAVGIGIGPRVALQPGSRVHDEIVLGPDGIDRPTNRAGGLEGGVSNGQEIRVTGYMKPISTLMKPLRSVDLSTLAEAPATIERSDVCAVPAAAVVGEAVVCLVLADALTERFGSDTVEALEAACEAARAQISRRLGHSSR